MNMAIPTLGVNKMIRSLAWDRAGQFRETSTGLFRFGGRIGEGSRLYPDTLIIDLTLSMFQLGPTVRLEP